MHWSIRTSIVLATLILSVVGTTETSSAKTKVFLLGGQSNMDGRASQSGLPTALRNPQPDILFYPQAATPIIGGSLTSLQPGSTRFDAFKLLFGPEVTFGRSVADAFPNEDFAIIKHGVGGTSLAVDWAPSTGPIYTAFKNTVAEGLEALSQAGHTIEIAGMLWLQGERDVVLSDAIANAYETNLTAFIADVRSEYGADLPFLIGQLSSNQTNLNAARLAIVRQAQENVSNSVPNTALIVSESFSIKSDNLHFDAAGQIAFGESFAAAYQQFAVPEPSSLTCLAIGIFLLGSYRSGPNRRLQSPFFL